MLKIPTMFKVFAPLLCLLAGFSGFSQSVRYAGKMTKVGTDRNLSADILIDTLQTKNLYAIGPVENLRGEIIVWNGRPFVAAIKEENGQPYVQKEVKDLKAIFLVYSHVEKWDTIVVHKQVGSMAELENLVGELAFRNGQDTAEAFPFLITGKIRSGAGHIMFKKEKPGPVSAEEVKQASHRFEFRAGRVQMLGFYSRHHQRVFTHADSFIHVHYRFANRYEAGHLDAVVMDESEPIRLLIPHKKTSDETH